MDDDGPVSNRVAPDGSPYTFVVQLDFNALYGAMQLKPMPTTPGILWSWKNGKFVKSVMSDSVSYKSIQWLYWLEKTEELCIAGHRLHHAYHQGERRLGGLLVDGFVSDGVNRKIFEFQGCYFHGHNCSIGRSNPEKVQIDEQKRLKLLDFGEVIYKTECEWDELLPGVKNTKTRFPRILHKSDDTETLINGILSGELYGFIFCSVDGPEDLIESLAEQNFPPIFNKVNLTEEHLSPYMKSRYMAKDKKLKQESLVQTFRASNILLHTCLAQFYLEIGLKLFDIKWFTQYLGEASIAPFMKKVTSMRIEASQDKANPDKTKSNTAKIIGNSGKIYLFQVVDSRKSEFLFEF